MQHMHENILAHSQSKLKVYTESLSPAKSFTFTSAPSLMSSLMRRTSPRIAALCSRVSPLSFRLFTLSLVLDAEFGVPF